MLTTKTPSALAALLLASSLILSACSATSDQPSAPAEIEPPGPSVQTVDPDPAKAPAPVQATPKTGDVLTAAPDQLEPSQRAFPLPDGTLVIVDRYEPLPAGVQEVLDAQSAAAVTWQNVWISADEGSGDTDKTAREAIALRAEVGAATGKNVMVVYRVMGVFGCNGTGKDPWSILNQQADAHGGCAAWATREEAIAVANTLITAREDANTYIVVAGS